MKKRVIISKYIRVENTPGEKISDRTVGEISLREYKGNFFLCLKEGYVVLALYPKWMMASIPLNIYWDPKSTIFFGSMVIEIESSPESSQKEIELQQLGDGKLRIIEHAGNKDKTMEITAKNIHAFMLEFFGSKEFFWMLPIEEKRKLCPDNVLSKQKA
jgi:hypothetical protein